MIPGETKCTCPLHNCDAYIYGSIGEVLTNLVACLERMESRLADMEAKVDAYGYKANLSFAHLEADSIWMRRWQGIVNQLRPKPRQSDSLPEGLDDATKALQRRHGG